MNCQKQKQKKKNFIQLSLQRQFIWTTDSKQNIFAEREWDWNVVMCNDFYEFYYFRKWFLLHGISLKWRVNGIDCNITSCVYMFIKWQKKTTTTEKIRFPLKQKHCCAIWYVCKITEILCYFTRTTSSLSFSKNRSLLLPSCFWFCRRVGRRDEYPKTTLMVFV